MNRLERVVAAAKDRGDVLDLHLHTHHSVDVIDGCGFIEYVEAADRSGIIPGFLDHFQAERLADPGYPFTRDNVQVVLEEHDLARETGLRSYLGLEVDFYDEAHGEWNGLTADWLQDHAGQFDYFVGTIHDVLGHTITIPQELEALLETVPFEAVQDAYFKTLMEGIGAGLFDGFAHLDVIYRFCGNEGQNVLLPKNESYPSDSRTMTAIEYCMDNGLAIELNLRGLEHPWATTYPAWNQVAALVNRGPSPLFFTGSDAHDLSTFTRMARHVKEYDARVKKFPDR